MFYSVLLVAPLVTGSDVIVGIPVTAVFQDEISVLTLDMLYKYNLDKQNAQHKVVMRRYQIPAIYM